MGLLAGGLVFAIPTTIGVLSATSYKPEKNPDVDTAHSGSQDVALMQAIAARYALAHERVQPGVLNFNTQKSAQRLMSFRMPELNISSVYSAREAEMTRLAYLKDVPSTPSFRSVVLNLSF